MSCWTVTICEIADLNLLKTTEQTSNSPASNSASTFFATMSASLKASRRRPTSS